MQNAPQQMSQQNRPIPHVPDYQHKYNGGIMKQLDSDPLLQRNQAFIDPQTGIVYERYGGSKPDVLSSEKSMDTYRMQTMKENHIYNTLEPH